MKKIDAHMHLTVEHIPEALVTMDANDIECIVNARFWEEDAPADIVRRTRDLAGDRIATLCRVGTEEFGRIAEPGYVQKAVDAFRRAVDAGAKGLKVSKRLGLFSKFPDGEWVRVDDERLDPVWAAAGEMDVPVLLHTADPIVNWVPLEGNPKADRFRANPRIFFGDGKHFDRLELLAQRDRVLERHPETLFVNAHWGCYPEDLDHLVHLFETYPNFYVDAEPGKIATVPEGTVHTSRRDVFVKYVDRTLFGTDLAYWPGKQVDHPWNRDMYQRRFHFFEKSEDGGFELPEEVLRTFYSENARRVYRL